MRVQRAKKGRGAGLGGGGWGLELAACKFFKISCFRGVFNHENHES